MVLVGEKGRDDVINGRHLAIEDVLAREAGRMRGKRGGTTVESYLDSMVYEPSDKIRKVRTIK